MIEKEIKTQEITFNKYYCDVCKKEIINAPRKRIEYEDKESYNFGSDGGYEKTYIYDICDECMENVIFKYIKNKIKEEPRVEIKDW